MRRKDSPKSTFALNVGADETASSHLHESNRTKLTVLIVWCEFPGFWSCHMANMCRRDAPAKYREYSPPGARKKYRETRGKKREKMSVRGQTKFTVQTPEKISRDARKKREKMSVRGQTKFTVQTPEKIWRDARKEKRENICERPDKIRRSDARKNIEISDREAPTKQREN